MVRATNECIDKMGVCEVVYHDFEGSWNSKEFIKLINHFKIRQIITSSPAPFVERMIQTLKDMIHKRIEGLEIDKEKWVELIPVVLKLYNNKEHSTIGMAPVEALKEENHLHVNINIMSKAHFNMKYPPLKLKDEVRTYIKPHTFKKETSSIME